MTPHHYHRAINRAQLANFHALAASILALYRVAFPQDFSNQK